MTKRPETTLFMLTSLDGKISTGSTDALDFDQDLPTIAGVKDGLCQYYDLEKQTDLYSLNSGKVQAKIGWNEAKNDIDKTAVNFLIIDNEPHLTEVGVDNFLRKSNKLFIITTNKDHPAFERKDVDNLEILYFENRIDFKKLLDMLGERGVDRMTIQTGGCLNAEFLRNNLVDHVSIVIAPMLVGGKDTASLVDGTSFETVDELSKISILKLVSLTTLENSYVYVQYDVVH